MSQGVVIMLGEWLTWVMLEEILYWKYGTVMNIKKVREKLLNKERSSVELCKDCDSMILHIIDF